jgi:ATP-dependent exoDNAse (exonuclease V) beta subunit
LRSKQESSTVVDSNHERTPNVQTATAYLETLNPEQRRAVEHGPAGGLAAPPLLVIAGAGSGKTNTLAHRVAHLIVQGADPRRILLMTFSRRAASEMIKRVERIARKVLGDNAGSLRRHRRHRLRAYPRAEDRHGRWRSLPESRQRGTAALQAADHACDTRSHA